MVHSHNLSVNSINSIIEPTTPPKVGEISDHPTSHLHPFHAHSHSKSALWDSNSRLDHHLNLPSFELGATLESENAPIVEATKSKPLHANTSLNQAPNAKTLSKNLALNSSPSLVSQSKVTADTKVTDIPNQSKAKIDKEYLASINKLSLVQLKSEILRLSKDQYGCRFLQKKIDENLVSSYQVRLANFEIIFKQIHPYLYELIIDPFGNYLIQKLINYCDEENLTLILEILQSNLFQISINQHGTRALQKIIDNLNNQHQLNLLIKGLKPYIIELIKDLNGNHVIQKILNKYQPADCQFIYDSIIEDLYVVATHKHGCCVLQKCLNHVTLSQLTEFSQCILNFKNFQLLINDQFGNYVLQYLISINSLKINYKIFENFVQYGINNLCNLKFSSNVIEKFLKNCYNNEVCNIEFSNLKFELIYNILISELNKLINDPYGNYVIQTLVDILVHPQVKYLEEPKPDLLRRSSSPSSPVAPTLLASKLSLLLPSDYAHMFYSESLQIVIIKYWFQNCKIVSSFGKRIQSKINLILNNGVNSQIQQNFGKIKSRSVSIDSKVEANGSTAQNSTGQFPQSMNSNGEFTVLNNNDHSNYRSLSVPSNQEVNAKLNHAYHVQNPRNLSLPSNYLNSGTNSMINNYVFGQGSDSVSSNNLPAQHPQHQPHMFVNNNDFMVNEHPFGYPTHTGQLGPNGMGESNGPIFNRSTPISHHYSFSSGSNEVNGPTKHQHQLSFSGSSSSNELNANGNSVSMTPVHKQHSSVSSVSQLNPHPLGQYTTSNYYNMGMYASPPMGYNPSSMNNYGPSQHPPINQGPYNQKGMQQAFHPNHQSQNFQQGPYVQYPSGQGQQGSMGNNFRGVGFGSNHSHNLSVSSTSSLHNGGSNASGINFNAPTNGTGNPLVAPNYYQG